MAFEFMKHVFDRLFNSGLNGSTPMSTSLISKSKDQKEEDRKARGLAKAKAAKAASDHLLAQLEQIEALRIPEETLAVMFTRLNELENVKELEQLVVNGEDFPEYSHRWNNRLFKDVDFWEVLVASVNVNILDKTKCNQAFSDESYKGFPIWTLSNPDAPPVLPAPFDALPWFKPVVLPAHQRKWD